MGVPQVIGRSGKSVAVTGVNGSTPAPWTSNSTLSKRAALAGATSTDWPARSATLPKEPVPTRVPAASSNTCRLPSVGVSEAAEVSANR